jgi:hypothetical protein
MHLTRDAKLLAGMLCILLLTGVGLLRNIAAGAQDAPCAV